MDGWLHTGLVYLGAAVLAVPLARLLGLGAIIGYLGAGIVIGPFGLGLVREPAEILHFAEFGVVLMLFLVGLELQPERLWAMRRPIFGWGSVQLLGCAALIGGAAWLSGLSPEASIVVGFGLAMSSTAIGLGVLGERRLMGSRAGQGVLGVALLQDVAAIPLLALLPLLAAQGAQADGESRWLHGAFVVAVIAAIVLGGRLLLRPALRWIARSRTPEIFTAAALLLVVATAAAMEAVGLSMALGAFLAGVLLADSEYRRELETDLEPFEGLLLGLFFIAVGMSIDFEVVLAQPGLIAAAVAGLLLLKALVLLPMARAMGLPLGERRFFVLLLAQGGEFGFVVFQTALQGGVVPPALASQGIAAVALSMLLTPVLLVLADRWARRHAPAKKTALEEIAEPQDSPVIIAGFGRYGQIVGRLLNANGLEATVLEHDPEQVEAVRRFGWPVFYGDATRLDLLRTAGAAEAKVLVVAVDDVDASLTLVKLAREHFPQLHLVVRARNVRHYYQLRDLGIDDIERETLDAALMSGRSVLQALGWSAHAARNQALRFRRHSIEQLEAMAPHFRDQQRLIAMSKQGRAQLEALWAEERAAAEQRRAGNSWVGEAVKPGEEQPVQDDAAEVPRR